LTHAAMDWQVAIVDAQEGNCCEVSLHLLIIIKSSSTH
jgi:hypothetical protein